MSEWATIRTDARIVGSPDIRLWSMLLPIQETVVIAADEASVWKALTEPDRMKLWMGEPEMEIAVRTDWKIGGPIVISGFHHGRFENRGTVLAFDPHKTLRYTHLSSVSRLPDQPGSYCVLDFSLEPVGEGTSLTLTITNFPTETIYKHLAFYWKTTLKVIKELVETHV